MARRAPDAAAAAAVAADNFHEGPSSNYAMRASLVRMTTASIPCLQCFSSSFSLPENEKQLRSDLAKLIKTTRTTGERGFFRAFTCAQKPSVFSDRAEKELDAGLRV